MPVWHIRIDVSDVFRNETMTFEERRDAIVNRLRTSRWFGLRHDEDDREQLQLLLEELADVSDVDEFDGVWSWIYDEADADRVWISTIPSPKVASR